MNAGPAGRERPQILRQNSYPGPSNRENELDGDEAELLAKLSSSKSMVAPSVALDKDFWGSNLDIVHNVNPSSSHSRSFLDKRSTSPKQFLATQSFIVNDERRSKRRSQATSGSRYYANMVMRKMHGHSFDRPQRSPVEAIYAESFGVTPMEDLHRVSSFRMQ
ncbi:hypothetical protein GUITHDRAFT_101585 [Guillardia theta CCMP2712]|uniref:Uncharacterized protein n=1 Tax=Guillardia theta (strain CCMP2712) TaxID=905079 RepID=L1JVK5_GUITC|nr:hypothetical protein GUITHDRAFT_101585 [Guillardia theta CCMP2712]EKX52412.1 hypothetical protein GUITHDRAFT_101585 [Guillardia theta CCMP2712]|eukprot:XP_005839392.1 hypothetical protein GUITHDRAFT_101585 [Guillardia theta CCMP2712]